MPEYKLKIFVDALQEHFDRESILDFAEDDLAAYGDDWSSYDESGDDIAADLIEVQRGIRKGRRKLAQQKWRQTEAGKAATKAWNESKEKKTWRQTEAGRVAKKRERKTWKKTETGKLSTNATKRKKTLDRYLNRRTVAIDGEGRCPLHMIDDKGRTPLEAYKETHVVSKYLKKDSSGHYWEPHELSLIGAATIDRPYGTPLEKGTWEPPVWIELTPKYQSEQTFEYLLSLAGKPPLYIMFSASYDWSMWLGDTPFGKAFEIARQRSFAPPCKRTRGMVFWKKYAIKVRPYYDFKLSELRWPDGPYGKDHTDDPPPPLRASF